MRPSSGLVMAERDGYFAICPSPRPNPGEDEVVVREQPPSALARIATLAIVARIAWSNGADCHTLADPKQTAGRSEFAQLMNQAHGFMPRRQAVSKQATCGSSVNRC